MSALNSAHVNFDKNQLRIVKHEQVNKREYTNENRCSTPVLMVSVAFMHLYTMYVCEG